MRKKVGAKDLLADLEGDGYSEEDYDVRFFFFFFCSAFFLCSSFSSFSIH